MEDSLGPSVALGLAPFIMQSTESLIAVCFNTSLLKYGDDLAVAAMTILTSVMQLAMLPLSGFTQGAQPIVSYNYGARNADRVRKAFKLLLICCVTYSFALWAAVELVPQVFVKIFNSEPDLIEFASRALRIYMAMGLILGVQIACQQTFIALGNAKCSLFLGAFAQDNTADTADIHTALVHGRQDHGGVPGRTCGRLAGRDHDGDTVYRAVQARHEPAR